ncbi:hypothetical protein [Paraburkholderia youngii]|uniref:hypothetical protein n=1 Tax=Paraburkholderia youngii TaxID=2782701 RepID=UPI00159175D1|nr:hypothetical protein [Paraburkholderia youngii]NUX58676.1 hypothetical protein [Paraburkholderia youngii]
MMLPVGLTRAELRDTMKARRVMRADFRNRFNTLRLRVAARDAFNECSERIRTELHGGARQR